MRLALTIVCLAAACTTSSGTSASCGGGPLSCTGVDCRLATAENDASLCPAFEQQCAGYTIITEQGTDTATDRYYDASGALVATVHVEPSGDVVCTGSPAFRVPACLTASTMLPVCGAQP